MAQLLAWGWLQSVSAALGGNGVYSFSLTFAGNGNVLTGNDSVNGNWTYGYDDFNRLASASKTGASYTYDYDRFGNRWHQTGPSTMNLGFDANNRITGSGVIYDAAGNVTNDGQNSYTYDAENRIISESGPNGTGTYVYSAAGMRVRKTTAGGTVDYLYDLAGHAITELNTSGAWTRTEVYAGSRHVATYKDGPAGTTYFSHTDWLGTERVRTGPTGATVESCTSLPFGDAQSCTGSSTSPLHFTGKERDPESDNDYFGARYYISRHGRWLTPDWSSRQEAVPYASLANPQTLNLYAYVGNNPIGQTDPDGHSCAITGCDEENSAKVEQKHGETVETPGPRNEQQEEQQQQQQQSQQQTSNQQDAQKQKSQPQELDYKSGVPHATGELEKALICTQTCAGEKSKITSTHEKTPVHPPGTPHAERQAADERVRPGQENKVLSCATQCGFRFGLNERQHPSKHSTAPHVHLQLNPGKRGGRGDLPKPKTVKEED